MTRLTDEAREALEMARNNALESAVYHVSRASVLAQLALVEQLRVANLLTYTTEVLVKLPRLDADAKEQLAAKIGHEVLAGLDLEVR